MRRQKSALGCLQARRTETFRSSRSEASASIRERGRWKMGTGQLQWVEGNQGLREWSLWRTLAVNGEGDTASAQ